MIQGLAWGAVTLERTDERQHIHIKMLLKDDPEHSVQVSSLILHKQDSMSFMNDPRKFLVTVQRDPPLPHDFTTDDMKYPVLRFTQLNDILLEDSKRARDVISQRRKRSLAPDMQEQDAEDAERDVNDPDGPDNTARK